MDRIKQARNHILNELLVKNLPDTDTLFFIEKYEGNFVTGQIWGGKVDTIKYIANFNSNITILTKEELFSPKFSKLTAEWNIEQIDSINDKEKNFPPNNCFITKVIFAQKNIINICCHYMNLKF